MASSRRLPTAYNTSTYGDGTRDYSALATWEAATDNDLVTATAGEVLECYDDSASFDDSVLLTGATTNSSYFRVIKPAAGEGHDGTPNNGVTFVGTSNDIIISVENYFQAHDLIALNSSLRGMYITGGGDYSAFIGCIATGTTTGITLNAPEAKVINCLVYDAGNGFACAGTTSYVYNCTAADCTTGFFRTSGTAVAKNCISCDNTTDFDGTWTKTTCYEGDATVFADQASDDYHLASGDTTARGNGTDLSGDGTYAFDDDIDATARLAWDIGFDEFTATATGGFGRLRFGFVRR